MSAFDQLVKNNAAALAAARRSEAVPLRPVASAAELLGLPFIDGQRVVDAVSGEIGTVTAGTIQHSVQPAPPAADGAAAHSFLHLPKPVSRIVITVALDGGSIVTRDPAQLAGLPSALNVPLASLEPV